MITSMKDDGRDKETSKRKETLVTCIVRCLLSLLTSVLNGSRAETSLQQSTQEERKGTSHKDTTSREETMTSTSHLGLQCSDNIGALQHHYHYDWCTSCNLEDDIKEEKTSWPLALASMTSTSRIESATTTSTNTYSLRRYNTYIPRVGS